MFVLGDDMVTNRHQWIFDRKPHPRLHTRLLKSTMRIGVLAL